MINTCKVKITESDSIPKNSIKKCGFTVYRNGEVQTVEQEGKDIFPLIMSDVVCGSTFFVNVPCYELSVGFDTGKRIDGDGETEILQTPLKDKEMNLVLYNGVGTL